MSFLRSTPVLCFTSFILGIAILIQCELILSGRNLISLMGPLILQIVSKYHQSYSRFSEPHSIGGHITTEHNLCTDITNETISCELRAFSSIIERVSQWEPIKQNPETLVPTLRWRMSQNAQMKK